MRTPLVCLVMLLHGAAVAQVDAATAALGIAEQTNRLRAAERLPPTRPSPTLAAAAQRFADFMAQGDRYGHTADGREPSARAAAAGYDWCVVTENIAYIQDARLRAADALAERFVGNWRDSPGHRRNMLDAGVGETGVGVAYSPRSERWYAVQMFGLPHAAAIRFDIANHGRQAVRYDLDGERYELAPNMTRSHERCNAATLALQLPGQPRPVIVEPADGQHWHVEPTGGGDVRLLLAPR